MLASWESSCSNFGHGVKMCIMCLRCVLDKNETPFLIFFKTFACLLSKLFFKDILLVKFLACNLKFQHG